MKLIRTCKTVLEIGCSDIKYMGDLGDYRDPGWERYWVICEACGLESTLKSEDLPFIIKRTAQLRGIKNEKNNTKTRNAYL